MWGWKSKRESCTPRTPSGSFPCTPQPLTQPAKHVSLSFFSPEDKQSKGRVKVGVCDYICSGKTSFCLKKKKEKKITHHLHSKKKDVITNYEGYTETTKDGVGWRVELRWMWEGKRTSSSRWLFSPSSQEIHL